jgi:RND family efflux transporter MFP subunit
MSDPSNPAPSNQASPKAAPPSHVHSAAPDAEPMRARGVVLWVVIVLLAFVALGAFGILRRVHSRDVLAQTTNTLAAPTVVALAPQKAAPVDQFVLPGNVTAYTDSPIYARTSGYLTHWYFDIGARVKKGDLLADISTPELDQQLLQAEADLKTAEATANNAHIQAERYTGLVKSEAVSQQDTDTFVNQANATSAAVKSAQANVQRLKELQSFEKIYAPFDGVVTARNIDIGQLIDTGTNRELFHLQALNVLRVYTNVPQAYANTVKRGDKIDLTFDGFPGRTFQGNLVRTADAIDPVSRTLLVEIDVDNREHQLLPGALAEVHFKTPPVGPTFVVPVSALIFRREGLQIGTVIDKNSQTVAHIIPITIGQDDGATVQVISGLNAADRVIQDPPDSLIEGERVTVVNNEQQQSGAQSEAGGK